MNNHNPQTAFLLSVQDLLTNEIVVAKESCPSQKIELDRLYNRINGFLNTLKEGTK